jgi:membrane protein
LIEAARRWVDDGCYRLSASLAYYALFSVFPLLLLCVTVFELVLGQGPELREQLVASVSAVGSPAFVTLVNQTLVSMQAHGRHGAGAAVGAVALWFGASSVFSELQFALNKIWRVRPRVYPRLASRLLSVIKEKAVAFAVVVGAAVTLLALLVVNTTVSLLGAAAHGGGLERLVSLPAELLLSVGLQTLLIASLFRMLPETRVEWGDVLGGAIFTALLLTALKHVLATYLAGLTSYAAYGAVGAVLGFLTWIYLSSLSLFFGAEITRVYAERHGSLRRGHLHDDAPQRA